MVSPWIQSDLWKTEPWEGETATGETSSDDDYSYSTMPSEGQESPLFMNDMNPMDLNVSPILAYSAFSGMPRLF